MAKKKQLTKEQIKESLKITSETSNRGRDIAKFMPIVEMIARKEFQSISGNVISYDDLVNTGLIAVNKLITTANNTPKAEFNSSYIAQSVKWAMKDEVRSRQAWYGVKKTDPGASRDKSKIPDSTETTVVRNYDDAKKAVFEVIMSIDSMSDDVGFTPEDKNSPDYLENLEIQEMKDSLKKSVSKLPDNLRQVIEMRFYKNMSGNEAAQKLGVTPSRVSHMINEAVKRLKVFMVAEGYRD